MNRPVTSAHELLELVRQYGPAVEEGELTFTTDPAPELCLALGVLHTGIRARLTGRNWWATLVTPPHASGRFSKVLVVQLSPDEPLPLRAKLLCVEGDQNWDRIAPTAQSDLPSLFAPSVEACL